MQRQELYGGAMETQLAAPLLDASNLRVVPDHQEVFVERDGHDSAIIELLAREGEVPDAGICEHLFKDIGEANDAESCEVLQVLPLNGLGLMPHFPDAKFSKWALAGRQRVLKDHKVDTVQMVLVCVRLVEAASELAITLNHPGDSALQFTAQCLGNEWFTALVHNLKVNDWGLFAA